MPDDPAEIPTHDSPLLRFLRATVGLGFRLLARLQLSPPPVVCAPPGADGKPLVVMLHGYQGSAAEFGALYHYLYDAIGDRFDFVLVDTLDPSMGLSPEENARRVADYLAERGLSSRTLYLIGHSAGGLIARCFSHLPDAPPIRAMVLIATSNGGINLWNLLPIHWMRTAGFDARFNARYPARPPTRYLLIAGTRGNNLPEGQPNDRVVGQWSVRRFLQFADPNTHLRTVDYPLDHWALLRSSEVAEEIRRFVEEE